MFLNYVPREQYSEGRLVSLNHLFLFVVVYTINTPVIGIWKFILPSFPVSMPLNHSFFFPHLVARCWAFTPWRRKWQPTPVFFPEKIPWTEEPHGQRSLTDYSPWGCRIRHIEATEHAHTLDAYYMIAPWSVLGTPSKEDGQELDFTILWAIAC